LWNPPIVGDRCQLDQPRAIGEMVVQIRSDLDRQSSLADSTWASQRDQPRLAAQKPREIMPVDFATNKAGELCGQIVCQRATMYSLLGVVNGPC